jgi:hypothetical protein
VVKLNTNTENLDNFLFVYMKNSACERSLIGVKGVISAKSPDHSRPQFRLSLLGALASMGTWRHLAAKVGTSKGRKEKATANYP